MRGHGRRRSESALAGGCAMGPAERASRDRDGDRDALTNLISSASPPSSPITPSSNTFCASISGRSAYWTIGGSGKDAARGRFPGRLFRFAEVGWCGRPRRAAGLGCVPGCVPECLALASAGCDDRTAPAIAGPRSEWHLRNALRHGNSSRVGTLWRICRQGVGTNWILNKKQISKPKSTAAECTRNESVCVLFLRGCVSQGG